MARSVWDAESRKFEILNAICSFVANKIIITLEALILADLLM